MFHRNGPPSTRDDRTHVVDVAADGQSRAAIPEPGEQTTSDGTGHGRLINQGTVQFTGGRTHHRPEWARRLNGVWLTIRIASAPTSSPTATTR